MICSASDCDTNPDAWIPWRNTTFDQNVVWGSACGGNDCQTAWSTDMMFGSGAGSETVVWGMTDGDTVVWGMNCTSASCAPVIWSRW